jgi:phosphoglycerate dehydrogenase-like enzyme
VPVGELICGLRRMHINAAANKQGLAGKPAGISVLSGSTVGVIGASEVGKRVMALLRPFSCQVLCYDPFATAASLASLGAKRVETVAELCAQSDAVTLHTPLLPATKGLVGSVELARLRDGGLFINTSRGECVDEAALIAELKTGRMHAYLDVTSPEPAAADSPLRSLPNVVLTSHIAGPACAHLGRRAVDDLRAFLSGGSPQCVVTADVLERIA